MLHELLQVVTLAEKLLSADGFSELFVLLAMFFLLFYSRRSQSSFKKTIVEICTGKGKHQQTLSGKQDLVINDALAHLVFDLSANRAWVIQQHNGDYNAVTGMSFKKISMTHECPEPGCQRQLKNAVNAAM